MLTYIDHVILAVRDLDVAVAQFRERMSFHVITGGRHPEFGTVNAIIPTGQGYLELIAVIDPSTAARSDFGSGVMRFLEQREGLVGFALTSSNIAEDVRALREAGSSIGQPTRGVAERDGRTRGWTAAFPPAGGDVPMPFLIQHDQRALERWRAWTGAAVARQPYGVTSVQEVTIAVGDVPAAMSAYEREMGLVVGRRLGSVVQMALPDGRISLVPRSVLGSDQPIGLYSAGLGTSELGPARDELRRRGIAFRGNPFTSGVAAQIDPLETFGARIDLVQG